MQITLIRHGKPILPPSRWLAPYEMAQWIAAYDQSLVETTTIPAASFAACSGATIIFASTLARAMSSASALGHHAPCIDAVFREAALPFPLWRFPRLPAPLWAALFRLSWLLGYSRGADALASVTARARNASALLVAGAADGRVLLIGHGVMNRLIARELRAAGWTGTGMHGSGYWSTVSLKSPG
ncbi:MAG: histidine phosphatase family protein [Pseudomonadota bacterium]|nr:histidine phosphatase family protein [Pseudomonadota bacterium]